MKRSGESWTIAAQKSELWQVKPGPPRRDATATELIGLYKSNDGRLLIAMHGGGLGQLVDGRVVPDRAGEDSLQAQAGRPE